MYSVLIADDEDIIREGFVEFVPWKDFGFEVVYTCENGDQAIEYIRSHHVDFIMTDIIMLGTTGLDVAKYVNEHSPSSIVCIISGHRNFEYAQQAIKYNVKYYLTKPTDFDELTNMLKEIKELLDKRSSLINDQELFRQKRTQFFSDVFSGCLGKPEDMSSTALAIDINPENIFICPVWITVKNFYGYIEEKWNYGKEMLFTAILNFLRDNLKKFEIYNIMTDHDEFMVLVTLNSPPQNIRECLEADLEAAKNSIACFMELDIDYQTGNSFHNLYDFASGFLSDKNDDRESFKHNKSMLMELYKSIIFSLMLGSSQRLSSVFANIASIFAPIPAQNAKDSMKELMRIIFQKLKNISHKDFSELFNEYYSALDQMNDTKQILDSSHSLLINISHNINAKDSPSDLIIEKAKEYITAHYSDNISLEDVANYVFLNASYFSRLFKQYTGENFRDYLINIRISKAIELINENKYKIYEISEKCGYKNPKYFAQQFKHVTGLSPTEYLSQKGQNQ